MRTLIRRSIEQQIADLEQRYPELKLPEEARPAGVLGRAIGMLRATRESFPRKQWESNLSELATKMQSEYGGDLLAIRNLLSRMSVQKVAPEGENVWANAVKLGWVKGE